MAGALGARTPRRRHRPARALLSWGLPLWAAACFVGAGFLHAPRLGVHRVGRSWGRHGKSAPRAGRTAGPETEIAPALQQAADLELLKAQNAAGHAMRDLGLRLGRQRFQGDALGGQVRATFDGIQRLRSVDVGSKALDAAGGRPALAAAVLAALVEAHDKSQEATAGDVWGLYEGSSELLQAPLVQIGAGSTAEDLWANVTRTDETVRLAEELFTKYDEDQDGFWNLKETSQVQLATEGTDMAEEAFNALIIAAAADGGRNLTEDDLARGLSKQQVVELYTDAARQRQLGFMLDIFKDHAKVFQAAEAAATEQPDAAEAAGAAPQGSEPAD